MRIAQVTPVYPPYRGGIGAVAFEYTERLRERGHDVQVFTPDYGRGVPLPFQGGSDEYVHLLKPLIAIGNAAVTPSLRTRLNDFDVVHLHYPFFGGSEFVWLAKNVSNKPLVTTYHMDVFAGGLKGLVFKTHGELLKRMVLAASDRVLVSSLDYAMNSSIKNYVSNNLETVIEMPFVIDADVFQPVSQENEVPRIIFVGGLDQAHYFKGVPVLLRALQELRDLPWELTIVGEGTLRPTYEKMTETLGFADRVTFAGSASPEELVSLYQQSDLHVLPAVDSSEAFGIVTLEAAASGIPSIVSDLPGVRTVIEEGKTGLIARPGDSRSLASALEDLLTNHGRRKQYGIDARKRVQEKYAWPVLLDRLEKVYFSLT